MGKSVFYLSAFKSENMVYSEIIMNIFISFNGKELFPMYWILLNWPNGSIWLIPLHVYVCISNQTAKKFLKTPINDSFSVLNWGLSQVTWKITNIIIKFDKVSLKIYKKFNGNKFSFSMKWPHLLQHNKIDQIERIFTHCFTHTNFSYIQEFGNISNLKPDFLNIQTGNTMISFHRLKLDKSFIAVWLKNFNTEDRRGSENNMEVTEWDKTNENMPSLSRLFPE